MPRSTHLIRRATKQIKAKTPVPTTSYPMLPHVMDDESLTVITTFENAEKDFVNQKKTPRQRYLLGLYLKAIQLLGHAHYRPEQLPLQFRRRIADQLGIASDIARRNFSSKSEKSRIVAEVRRFLGLRPATRADKLALQEWLEKTLARRETDQRLLVLAAVERLRSNGFELPLSSELFNLAKKALVKADTEVLTKINAGLNKMDIAKLDEIIESNEGRTPLERFKAPPPKATSNNMLEELNRIEALRTFLPHNHPQNAISNRKVSQLAQLANRYNASEIRQLKPTKRYSLLVCFVAKRYSELLDSTVDMFIRTWDQAKSASREYANQTQEAQADSNEKYQDILKRLFKIISTSQSEIELWQKIHRFKSDIEFETVHEELKEITNWNHEYIVKLEDHYSSLRRFMPDMYRKLPICSVTSDDSIPEGIRFAARHAVPGSRLLPVEDCPTDFLTSPWAGRAVKRDRRSKKLAWVRKVPYELGLVEAVTSGLRDATLAVEQSHHYAPMTDHLLPRESFLAGFTDHTTRLGHPITASTHYEALRDKLSEDLMMFDRRYPAIKNTFWVHKQGTLGFSRVPGQPTKKRLKKVARSIGGSIPPVSILDILLDCHRWTGFLDLFKPVSGRQNMPESELVPQLLAALYAYGCNCGPSQAAKAIGLSRNQVIYARRRFMAVESLMNAARILAEAYQRIPMAQRLGDPNVLMTDSMQVRTQKDSLIARQHHRYRDGKSTLLFQHVTGNCVCMFTQALLCNVSEAIHMLVGALHCRTGDGPLINICDSAGKSDLVFGLSSLLNIELFPRVRSRNLKLWGVGSHTKYKHINNALAGEIQFSHIDKGWPDMMWILASIEAGTAEPALIFERLAAQPKHPATVGFEELGKLNRSLYLLRYGMDMELRQFVVPYTSRREHWNKFTGEVQAFGDLIREKSIEDHTEIFWFLTVMQNAIVLWNVLALEQAGGNINVTDEDLAHFLPTMTEHINFVGRFFLDLRRQPPFVLRQAA